MALENIEQILEPDSKYLFLDDDGMTQACRIRGVEGRSLLFFHPDSLRSLDDDTTVSGSFTRKGYFTAREGKGIVRFEGRCWKKAGDSSKHSLPLYRLTIDWDHLKLVDRREFIRHKLKQSLPLVFQYDGRMIEAELVNISEGGLCLKVSRPMPLNIIFELDLKLPRSGTSTPFHFHTDGLVVYSNYEKGTGLVTGVAFVAPRFMTETERLEYQNQRHLFLEYLAEECHA